MFPFFLIIILLLYTLLTWQNLRLGLFLIAASLPSYLIRFSFFPFPTTLLESLVIILIIIWFIQKRFSFKLIKENQTLFILISLLFFSASINTFFTTDHLASLGILKAYFLEPFFLFLISLDLLKTSSTQNKIINYLGLSTLPIIFLAFFQKITQLSIPAPWDIEGRITSIFPYPNAVGLYLGPIIILGIFYLFSPTYIKLFKKTFSSKFHFSYQSLFLFFWPIIIILSFISLIFSQTEAVYFAIPISLILILLFFSDYKKITLFFSIIIISFLILLPASRQIIWQKISLQDYSGSVRLTQWQESWQMLKNQPLFGAGLSGYPSALKPYHQHLEIEIFQYPHNFILNIWSELGILGLITTLLISLFLIKKLFKHHHSLNYLSLGTFTALIEITIHGLVDVPYFKNDLSILTWLIIALFILSLKTDKKTLPYE